MEGSNKISMGIVVLTAVAGLAIGGIGGYFLGQSFGETKGVEAGRAQALAEQAAIETAKLQELQKAANPFSEAQDAANPFKDSYQNPFAE